MKKKYVTPKLEDVVLEAEDVLTNSAELLDGENEIVEQWWING